MSTATAQHEKTVEEVAWAELSEAIEANRQSLRRKNGTLTLELQFADGRIAGVRTTVSALKRINERPSLT